MESINDIFKRFLNDSCTADELQVLLQYFDLDEESSAHLKELIEAELSKTEGQKQGPAYLQPMVERNRVLLQKHIRDTPVYKENPFIKRSKVRRLVVGISIAASICLVSIFTFLYIQNQRNSTNSIVSTRGGDDVNPGTNKATLTLADGNTIALSDTQNGIIIGSDDIKYTDGQSVGANNHSPVNTHSPEYLSLTIPRAGQYQIQLPDGTKVWLNAESTLEYPNAFSGKERKVTLNGEAYFEVAHNSRQPFIVQSGSQRIQVLGTSFNVQAYPEDKTIATTLIEGKVALTTTFAKGETIMKPGQQAVLNSIGYKLQSVDVSSFTAWKEGMFRFKATPLPEALRQLERWYDIEVDYSQIPNDIKVHASIQRNKKLSSVLYALEEISHVKFEIQGRRLVLMK